MQTLDYSPPGPEDQSQGRKQMRANDPSSGQSLWPLGAARQMKDNQLIARGGGAVKGVGSGACVWSAIRQQLLIINA